MARARNIKKIPTIMEGKLGGIVITTKRKREKRRRKFEDAPILPLF